jgi:N-acetylglucosamine-6-phosphate deacetylase
VFLPEAPRRIFARRLYPGKGQDALKDHVVEISDRRIVTCRPATPADARDRGTQDCDILAPGFIDLQINGAGDRQFNFDPTPETLQIMAEAAARGGTALILPTFITEEGAAYRVAIKAVARAMEDHTPGILGLHLEGPFLSPDRPGIHPAQAIRDMREDDLECLRDAVRQMPLLVTLAPECVSDASLQALAAAGARIFAGHSNADADRIDRATRHGLHGATHLFNAMSQMTSRAPGVAGAVMASRTLFAGIIADGHHVDWRTLRVALRAMPGRLFLVTDAMLTLAGTLTAFDLGGKAIRLSDGRLASAEGTLAGAHIDMVTCVKNAVSHGGCTLAEALDMASGIPARALGVADSLGRIEAGRRACLTMLSDRLEVQGVLTD